MELNLTSGSLEEQINFLKTIFDSIPFPIFIKNLNLEYVYTNRICAEKNGVKPEELVGKSDADLWYESLPLVDEYNENDLILIKTKKGFNKMIPIFTEKEIFYSLLTEEPLFDKNQNVVGIVGIFSDVDLNTSRRTLYNIEGYDENDNCMLFDYVYDQSKFIVVKKIPGFLSFYRPKLTIEEILNMKFIYEEDLYVVERFFNSFEEKKQVSHFLLRIYDDNKNIVPCAFEASCFFDKDGNPSRILGSIQPLKNEELKKEKIKIDLEQAKKQLFTLFSATYDISVYVNPDFDYYQILHSVDLFAKFQQKGDWNSFIEIMYERLHPRDCGVLKNIFSELNFENGISSVKAKKEFRYLDDDGHYRWKAFQIDKIKSGTSDGFILSFYDVTDAVLEREQRTIRDMNNELIDILSTVVEFRDTESGEHINRIKEFTRILLNQVNKVYGLEYTNSQIEVISNAAAMHDIGKIAISDKILLKPGKLTPDEYEQMKLHTIKGCDILQKMTNIQEKSYFQYSYEICRHHHERYDGKGYPDGLVGEQIPLEAQIVSVADVFDALTSNRCYKPAYPCEKALQMINNGECGVFSEKMLQCLNSAKDSLIEYANRTKRA